METNKITIHDNLTCSICNKQMRLLKWCDFSKYENLLEVTFKTEHPYCRGLVNKKNKLTKQVNDIEMKLKNKKAELVNLEYRLFQEIN